jgi:hypothetical protein
MPDVDRLPNIEDVFDWVRQAARDELASPRFAPGARQVVIVTPGRTLLFNPCPTPGAMPPQLVKIAESVIPSSVKRNIAAISYTELPAVHANPAGAIPFLGFLLGFAYIGHAVWVFEGHHSALAAGCRDADVLLVDGGMVPFLQPDWAEAARAVMRGKDIVVHDRATYRLSRI